MGLISTVTSIAEGGPVAKAARAWRDAYHGNAQFRRLGNAIEMLVWYCVLAVVFALLLRMSHADLEADIAEAQKQYEFSQESLNKARAATPGLEGEPLPTGVPPQQFEVAKAKEILTLEGQVLEAQAQLDAADAQRTYDSEVLGSGQLVMKRYPMSFLAILIAAILPWLTLLTTGKAPVHLALSGALTFKATPLSNLDTVEKKHAALILSAKAKENSAFSQALLLLFAGILTAFSGVYFFYSVTATKQVADLGSYYSSLLEYRDQIEKRYQPNAAPPPSNATSASEPSLGKVIAEDLFTALPRIGILVFIEIIALFFLKQYQAMREEYRYFEAIRRSREDAAFLLSYIEEKKIAVEFDKLMDHGIFVSSAGVLKSGETTALVEERKISKDEMNVIADIVKTGISQIRAK